MRPKAGTTLATLFALLASCSPAPPAAGPAPGAPSTAGAEGEAPRGTLPPVPARQGALAVDVVYPAEGAALTAADSNFVFGSVGTGAATLRINGAPVEVAPNGAFLAFLPVPPNGVYEVEAEAGGERASARRTVRVPARAAAPGRGGALAFVPGTLPRGVVTMAEGEPVTVRFRATPGAQARIVFPDGTSLPLVEQTSAERAEGFQQDRAAPREFTEYAASFPASAPLVSRDRAVGVPAVARQEGRTGTAMVELVRGRDTVRAPLELSLGVLRPGETRVAVAAGDRPDGLVIGTAVPGSGTPYHWAFPNGTRFTVTGERDGALRVRLTGDQSVWVDARQARLLPAGAPAPAAGVGTVRVVPSRDFVDLRITVSDRVPFRVLADGPFLTVEVYNAETRTNWMHYGSEDPFVRRVSWDQPRDDLYFVRMELDRPAWGWRSFWDESGALVVRVRRPPAVAAEQPLRNLLIGVDAGHPPGGAIGPTRLTEAEANLAIGKHLVRMLQAAGARVLETRPDTAAVGLAERTVAAERAGVHLLVSVHNNAFPDGVNPFENNGTTVFYNAPQSLGLARWMQRELLRELGLRDLGVARADLALVRPTWFPSVLTETLFLMVPQQEAALRDPQVHERIARAHFRAIEAFVREGVR
ncbi:MAG TPA: N-acetylmuramoyl-L-alanine amidase [Longimicrobium sp.]|nr:N-acetylmuramoyl-L-alanine amidase [Longimicrobium sp.]